MAAIVMAAVVVTVTVMVGRHDGLHAGLPDYRGRHVGLTGSGHGHIGVAPPLVAVGIDLRRDKKCIPVSISTAPCVYDPPASTKQHEALIITYYYFNYS